jgi:hypothetical protein
MSLKNSILSSLGISNTEKKPVYTDKIASGMTQDEQIAHLQGELVNSNHLIDELQNEIIALSATQNNPDAVKVLTVSTETFEHKGSKYGFNYAAVILDGSKITADDVLLSEELQAQLVEMGSGFLKLV